MDEKKKTTLSIIGEDGSIDEVEVVIAFEFKDTKKEYVVYIKRSNDYLRLKKTSGVDIRQKIFELHFLNNLCQCYLVHRNLLYSNECLSRL